MTEAEALDRIQALAVLWGQQRLEDRETIARIIETLEQAGRRIIEGGGEPPGAP